MDNKLVYSAPRIYAECIEVENVIATSKIVGTSEPHVESWEYGGEVSLYYEWETDPTY